MKINYYVVFLVFFFSAVNAQQSQGIQSNFNILWGAGGVIGNQDGQFSNAFVNATSYNPGDNVAAWTALSVFESNNVSPGNANWVRNLTGESQGAFWNNRPVLNSPSSANGSALFDSDYLDNGGVVANLGMGPAPGNHRGELISPRINLTGNTDLPISVNFFTYFRELDITDLSVSLSVDDGATWSGHNFLDLIEDETQEFIRIPFDNITSGISDLSQVRLRFSFQGYYYYCFIDDVSIVSSPEYDLKIAANALTGSLNNTAEQSYLTNNAYFPIDQLNINNLNWGANVRNLGINDIVSSDNTKLQLTVERNVSGAWQQVYSESKAIQSLTADESVYVNESSLQDVSWAIVGEYRARYTAVIESQIDEDLSNNSVSHFFNITPNNYASKVGKDANDKPIASKRIYPGATPGDFVQEFEFGTVFYFPNATATNLNIDAVNFKYFLNQNFDSSICGSSQTIQVKIYEFTDTSAGIISDWNQLTLLAQNNVTLSGLGTTIGAGSFHDASATNFIDVSTGLPMGTLADGHYFISLTIDVSSCGSTINPTNFTPFFAVDDTINYNGNSLQSSVNYVISPSTVRVVRVFSGETINGFGFGGKDIPSIGVELSSDCLTPINTNITQNGNELTADEINATYQWIDCNTNMPISGETNKIFTANVNGSYAVEISKNGCLGTSTCYLISTVGINDNMLNEVMIYPNPTKDLVKLYLGKNYDSISVQLSDVNGKVIFNDTFNNTDIVELSIKASPGLYFLNLKADNKHSVHKIVKE